jgi:hypothetical protein
MENKTTGIAVPVEAKPLPVSLPALRPILARAMMPMIMDNIAVTITIIGHTKLLNPGRRKKGNAKRVRMPNMSEAMAKRLVLTFTVSEVSVNPELQEVQSRASSGFWVPHFGQFIFDPLLAVRLQVKSRVCLRAGW